MAGFFVRTWNFSSVLPFLVPVSLIYMGFWWLFKVNFKSSNFLLKCYIHFVSFYVKSILFYKLLKSIYLFIKTYVIVLYKFVVVILILNCYVAIIIIIVMYISSLLLYFHTNELMKIYSAENSIRFQQITILN